MSTVKSIVVWTPLLIIVCSLVDGQSYSDEGECFPHHVHIAYGETLSDIVVLWATFSNCTSQVTYGNDVWNIKATSMGISVYFTDSELHHIHRVVLINLEANTTYYYKPINAQTPFYFKTPLSGTNWSPYMLVYGNLAGQSESIPILTDEVMKGCYTGVLHVGNFGFDLHDDGGQLGDRFMQRIQSIASMVPYMTSPGNDEINEDTFSQYRHRFSMPQTEFPIPLDRMWYSLNIGPIHFVSYSTEVFFTNGNAHVAAQHDWLIADLDQANQRRDEQPWVIAFGHRPMYCSINDVDCTQEHSPVRIGLEDLFYTYGVDLVLQAHEHLYERLWPMFHGVVLSRSYVNPKVPVQITTGTAGSRKITNPVDTEQTEWSAVRMTDKPYPSFGRLKVYNRTHLFWEQVSIHDEIVLDYIWIMKDSHGPYSQSDLPDELQDKVQTTIKQTINPGGQDSGNSDHSSIFLNGETTNTENNSDDPTINIAIGTSFGVFVLLFLIGILVACKIKRKPISYRRWDTVDYGRKFYSNVHEVENDTDDFEVDVTDGTLPTTKLLADGQTSK